jgi:YcaO-like protein with predicted kinase domain
MDDKVLAEVEQKKPEDTLRDVQPYLDEAGVTRLAELTGMDRIGIPVYAAIRPDSKSLAVDSGKGTTKEQAKCSAAMEAIERWAHDEYQLRGHEPHGTVAYKFPMVHGAVLSKDFNHHKWLQAVYYTSQESVYVPYYHVYNYEKRLPLYEQCWQSGTNGLAAGNTREEAILQGLYEIIERDAITLWMTRGARSGESRRIDDDEIYEPEIRRLLDMCIEAGVEVFIHEATTDIGIPVYFCLMVDCRADIGAYKGYGCSLDSNIAMQRSICEAAQSRAVFLTGGRDDMRWRKHLYESQIVSNKQRLAELDAEESHPYEPHVPWKEDSIEGKIKTMDELLVANGCGHVIVADILNREHVCVVKVMAEGLEGYWNPYLQLGKRAKP